MVNSGVASLCRPPNCTAGHSQSQYRVHNKRFIHMRAPPFRLIPHAVACGIFAAAIASPAAAVPVTFAQYVQQNGAQQAWSITTNAGGTTTVTANSNVFMSFSGVLGLPFAGPELATFSLTATSNSLGNCGINCGTGDSFVQAGYAGTFSFIDAGAAPGTNLLSGTFAVDGDPSTSGAQLRSTVGSSGAGINASSNLSNLTQLSMTSAYLSFAGQTSQNASFSLSSLIPNFATGAVVANQARPASGTFNASGTGTFSSDPGPTARVPEPASMALLGAGLIGLAAVRRRATVAATAAA